MEKTKCLSLEEVGDKLRKQKNFIVATSNDRVNVLNAAKLLGMEVKTKRLESGKFKVRFVKDVG